MRIFMLNALVSVVFLLQHIVYATALDYPYLAQYGTASFDVMGEIALDINKNLISSSRYQDIPLGGSLAKFDEAGNKVASLQLTISGGKNYMPKGVVASKTSSDYFTFGRLDGTLSQR